MTPTRESENQSCSGLYLVQTLGHRCAPAPAPYGALPQLLKTPRLQYRTPYYWVSNLVEHVGFSGLDKTEAVGALARKFEYDHLVISAKPRAALSQSYA